MGPSLDDGPLHRNEKRRTREVDEALERRAFLLVRLGVDARKPEQAAVCGHPCAEAVVLDGPKGTLLTLVNWTNGPLKALPVKVRLSAKP